MTAFKDVVGLLLLAFLLPLWIPLGLGALVVVVARQLYWWVRGNTSSASRVPALVRAFSSRPGRSRAAAPEPLAGPVAARLPRPPTPLPIALQ